MSQIRPDRIRRFDLQGRDYIDAIADILEGTSGEGPSTPLMDLVGQFQAIPTVKGRKEIKQWLAQIETYLHSYMCFMNERLGK